MVYTFEIVVQNSVVTVREMNDVSFNEAFNEFNRHLSYWQAEEPMKNIDATFDIRPDYDD